ncbi:MAG: GlsB/YeaQ/YmgE family stress response membrane protein [Proteobacteria bacterium]|nr:GlsB/YeaQ/YmgE family stress response membrane protein [Pseudomonadota bacterium]
MFNIIGAIISGLIVGAMARWLYPGATEMGWTMTVLLGVGGSLFAGLITARGKGDGLNRAGCLASILGAMALIFIGRHLGWHF